MKFIMYHIWALEYEIINRCILCQESLQKWRSGEGVEERDRRGRFTAATEEEIS